MPNYLKCFDTLNQGKKTQQNQYKHNPQNISNNDAVEPKLQAEQDIQEHKFENDRKKPQTENLQQ